MSDPSFVLVQVEGVKERVLRWLGAHDASPIPATDQNMREVIEPLLDGFLEALGLDRPGVAALDIEEGVVALRYRADVEDGLLRMTLPSSLETRARADRLVAALEAAKEQGS